MTKKKRTSKTKPKIKATGRTLAYVQTVGKNGKPGKPQPVIITTAKMVK